MIECEQDAIGTEQDALQTITGTSCSVRFAIVIRRLLERIGDFWKETNTSTRLKKHFTRESKRGVLMELSLEGSTHQAL